MIGGGRFTDQFIEEVRARTSVVALVSQSVSLKKRGGKYWGLCPFHGEKTASFTVDEARANYHCFGCGAHGDCFAWIMAMHDIGFLDAVSELARRAGLIEGEAGSKPLAPARIVARPDAEQDRQDRADKIAWSRRVWRACWPAPETLVDTYLAARGIDAAALPNGIPPTIRYHPALPHTEAGCSYPAMVAAIQDVSRNLTGIHRTYLSHDGTAKAAVRSAKRMGGVCWGGSIRLCPAAPSLAIAEGIETALSVMMATGQPTWASASLGNMAAMDLPPVVKTVLLCVDADSDPDALEMVIRKAIAFHAARGRQVRVARPPAGMDFNDQLRLVPAEGRA